MPTRYARLVRSGRIVPIERYGKAFHVVSPHAGPMAGFNRANGLTWIHGPYRTNDKRFILLPREHQ